MNYLDQVGLTHLVQTLSSAIRSKMSDEVSQENQDKIASIKAVINAINDIKDIIEEDEEITAQALVDLKTKIDVILEDKVDIEDYNSFYEEIELVHKTIAAALNDLQERKANTADIPEVIPISGGEIYNLN